MHPILADLEWFPGFVFVGIPSYVIGAMCLLVATCMKIFQEKYESPKLRRRFAIAGAALLLLGFISPALSGLIGPLIGW